MKVINKIKEKMIISLEVLPPDRGENLDSVFQTLDQLIYYPIDFISVTKHPPNIMIIEKDSKIISATEVERPGTIGTTVALKNRYNIDVIPHLICQGVNKYQIEDILIDLNLIGIENIFAIRGDSRDLNIKGDILPNNIKEEEYHKFSIDLVKQIKDMNSGKYLLSANKGSCTNFCIGVAGYPEKHFESPNMEQDFKYLIEKINAGANFIITQMVFDFKVIKKFIEKVKFYNKNIPIIVGIKPITSLKSLYNLPKRFFINIPQNLVNKMQNAKTEKQGFKIGIDYMVNFVQKLIAYKVDGIHFFTMGKGLSTKLILKYLFS